MDKIAKIGGRDAIAYTKQGGKPWHNKGTEMPGLMTPIQALIAAGCDYEVIKIRVGVLDEDFLDYTNIQVPNTYCTGRLGPDHIGDDPNNALKFTPFEGTVKGRYTIVQNRDAFAFLEPALGKDIAYLETVGALGNGECVWAMAKLPDEFEITKGDPVERYILIKNTHDGSGSLKAIFTPIRVVCYNTLTAAMRGATNVVSIRHTKNATKRLDELHTLLEANETYWEKAKEAYAAMQMRDMTQLEVIEFIEATFPGKRVKLKKDDGTVIEHVEVSTRTQNMRDSVMNLFEGAALGSDKVGRTPMGMFQAYTEWLDHHRSIKKTSDSWEATVFGSGVAKRQKAFDSLLALT